MRDGEIAVQRPLPVNAAVERVGERRDLAFRLRLSVEIGGRGQGTGKQEGRIDRRELGFPGSATGLHVQEVVEEPAVAGRVRLPALRALPEEPERREDALHRLGTRDEPPLRAGGVGSEREPHGGDARRRPFARAVANQPVGGVGLLEKVLERIPLELVQEDAGGDRGLSGRLGAPRSHGLGVFRAR
jgi:hypothetical protein